MNYRQIKETSFFYKKASYLENDYQKECLDYAQNMVDEILEQKDMQMPRCIILAV